MKKITVTLNSFFFIIGICYAQTHNVTGCYIWKSSYYLGDFQKLCLNKDSTFFYQRHQNDVLPDYFSKGKWSLINTSVKLISIESLFSDSQIVNDGGLLQDSLHIMVFDTEKGWKLQYFIFDIYDNTMSKISTIKTDSSGKVIIKTDTSFRYLKSRIYMDYSPILIDLENIKHENLLVKLNSYNMKYKNISHMNLSIDRRNVLTEKTKSGQEIQYFLEK